MRLRVVTNLVAVVVVVLAGWSPVALAQTFADPAFQALWAATDAPVASGEAVRAWVWGPEPISGAEQEPYAEAPGGTRLVQYFDKGRMELTNPGGPVTAGLLVREMITGQVQTGDRRMEQRTPAELGVAGDPDDILGPTYARLQPLLSRAPLAEHSPIIEVIGRDFSLGSDLVLSRHGVRADVFVPETGHRLANVFRAYFEGSPLPNTEGETPEAAPFAPWYSVTGLPITEAYWTRVRVGTITRDVLVQAFERRILTYTPDNPRGSRVEMGNVGRHYLAWRASRPSQPVEAGLSCPIIPELPAATREEKRLAVLGTALHQVGDRLFVSGAIRNDGPTRATLQVEVTAYASNGHRLGRYAGFTDREVLPGGQVTAFHVDLPPGLPLADWSLSLDGTEQRPSGGLAGGFSIEGMTGEVDGTGFGEVTGFVEYSGSDPFTDLVIVRVQALDACGSVVTTGFANLPGRTIAPGSRLPFSALLLRAEGVTQVRAVVEARTGTSALIADDALRVYHTSLYPTPIVPIVEHQGCCTYVRRYVRPDGTRVQSVYRRFGS